LITRIFGRIVKHLHPELLEKGEFLRILRLNLHMGLPVCAHAPRYRTKRNIRGSRMADRGVSGVASTTEAHVRLAVVEQVTDAVNRVLEKRCRSKDDDTDGWISKRNDVESYHAWCLLDKSS